MTFTPRMVTDLRALGVRPGGALMVPTSYRAFGADRPSPDEIFDALEQAVGPDGTLLVPALSYQQDPILHHDTRTTPSNVGYLAEYFRLHRAARRSLHPTHSVCATGAGVDEWLGGHELDRTPCGPNSPFRRILDRGGQILMLGCGLRPNTAMHAIEEVVGVPYALRGERTYAITDAQGVTRRQHHRCHDFGSMVQRYDRILDVPGGAEAVSTGLVLGAECHLIEAGRLFEVAKAAMMADPCVFVDDAPGPDPS